MSSVRTNHPIVVARLKQVPAALRRTLVKAMRKGCEMVRTMAQRDYLSGPRPDKLGVVTTRLRNSIAIGVQDDGSDITGRVGSNVVYAAYHEFGLFGTVSVRPHIRVAKVLDAKGRRISLNTIRGAIREKNTRKIVGFKRSATAGLASRPKLIAITSAVRGHSRRIAYGGRPYIGRSVVRCENGIASLVDTEMRAAMSRNQAGGGVA